MDRHHELSLPTLVSTCRSHKSGRSFQGVLPVLWVADFGKCHHSGTIHQTVARLGDLLKALKRLASVESDLSAQLVVGLNLLWVIVV
jgi:hypothetical protein